MILIILFPGPHIVLNEPYNDYQACALLLCNPLHNIMSGQYVPFDQLSFNGYQASASC